ncbi:MAG: ATP-binding protein [Suipraeoptans sp.]
MSKKEKKNKHLKVYIFVVIVVIICALIYIGHSIWNDYRNQIIQGQKDQMLLTTNSIADSLEANLTSYANDLEYLCRTHDDILTTDDAWQDVEEYVRIHDEYVFSSVLEDENNVMIKSTSGNGIINVHSDTEIDSMTTLQLVSLDNDVKYIAIKRTLLDGGMVSIIIDVRKYFDSIMSNIQMGTNGYVVIKDSNGVIIMYPSDNQLGLNVIDGRQEMFPEADLSSLVDMIEEQKKGVRGVSEYYSYWWDKIEENNTKDARVKKISAYSPSNFGDSFLIVSTVIDYDDFYIPIAEGYIKLTVLFIAILLFIIAISIYVGRLLILRQRYTKKIEYLTGLNTVLEEMHKSEENIAHSQRLQIMGTMTGGIAHEFNNILTPILGYADLLLLETEEGTEVHEQVVEIQDAALKAKEIIQQLSSMSRKNMETVYKKISTTDLIKRALKMVKSICPDNVKFIQDIHNDEEYILGNRTQINQVILNISLNAIQAMGHKDGELKITSSIVKSANLKTDKDKELWDKYLLIEIEDTGSGMSDEVLKQIFTPFFTTKTQGKGTGLGLALAEQIINSHKGEINVTSTLGEGSKFIVTIPVLSNKDEAYVKSREDDSAEKILLVDDNAKVLSMLEKGFLKVGIDVITATNFEQAKNVVNEDIAVIVMDQMIDGSSAIPFAMLIKEQYPNLIKIVAVDLADREIIEAKTREIIDDYIEKPLSVIEIIKRLRANLNNY